MECGLIFRGLSLSVNFEFEFDTSFFSRDVDFYLNDVLIIMVFLELGVVTVYNKNIDICNKDFVFYNEDVNFL